MGLIGLFKAGGVTMYPLLLFSIAIWTIIFERLWALKKFKREYFHSFKVAKELLNDKKISEARGAFRHSSKWVSTPALLLLDEGISTKELKGAKVKRKLQETNSYLRQYLWLLGTIGAAAPFVGLFGTITGIIRSFDAIAESGKSGFSTVAGGLSEALITTAAGILIAVVAVVFYNYLQVKINSISFDFRTKLEDLSDLL